MWLIPIPIRRMLYGILYFGFTIFPAIIFAQNVGIGLSNPTHAKLEVQGSVGASVAMFGSNSFGTTLSANNPELGFNYFYNGGTKTIKAGYGANIGMNPSTGNVYIGNFNGNQSTMDFGDITGFQEVLTVKQNGTVRIGSPSSTENAAFSVIHDKGIYATGVFGSGNTYTHNDYYSGAKLIWYAKKAAFRVGYVTGNTEFPFSTVWDDAFVGDYSMAMGKDVHANGAFSTAIGYLNYASDTCGTALGCDAWATGKWATAFGTSTTASGTSSTAMGYFTIASGYASTAMGLFTFATGERSTAMGSGSEASGYASTAMGYGTWASGDYSTAIGRSTTASGFNSTAMGYRARTNNHSYSFCISGNNSGSYVDNFADNQMIMDFPGGYYLWTGPSGEGVHLDPNGNGWLSGSDINRKENIIPLMDEEVLRKLSEITFSSWNYKGGRPQTERHYGIMAQDFFMHFGKDDVGTIGNDTTVNPIDMMGIAYSAIKALEERTKRISEQEIQIQALTEQNAELHATMNALLQKVDTWMAGKKEK